MNILMVCLGNICRSPLAEGILKAKIGDRHFVDSAGTGNWHVGNLPDKRSIQVAQNNAIDLTTQRARQFTKQDFNRFDLIFAMDESNYSNILDLAVNESDAKKVHLILEGAVQKNVPDPYYGDFSDFESLYKLLDKATEHVIEKYNL